VVAGCIVSAVGVVAEVRHLARQVAFYVPEPKSDGRGECGIPCT
jgi:hypothetical protein